MMHDVYQKDLKEYQGFPRQPDESSHLSDVAGGVLPSERKYPIVPDTLREPIYADDPFAAGGS